MSQAESLTVMNVFTFGDVHGRPKTLRALFEKARISFGDKIIGLGDYFDRGPDTKSVLDLLCSMRETYDLRCLVGNHDGFWMAAYSMHNILPNRMIRYGEHPEFNDIAEWFSSKSKMSTMASYGIDPENFDLDDLAAFPDDHIDFMTMLKPYELIEIGGHKYLFVHAGLPAAALLMPTVEEAVAWTLKNCPWEMTWGKTGLEVPPAFDDATIVHGHVPWNYVDEIVNGKPYNRVANPAAFNFPGPNHGKINLDASVGLDGKNYLAGMWLPSREIVLVEGDD